MLITFCGFKVIQEELDKEMWEIIYSANIDSLDSFKKEYYLKNGFNKNKNVYIQGFINKSRILFIDKLPSIPKKFYEKTINSITIKNDTILFTIKTLKFIAKNHKIFKNKTNFIEKIDGKQANGIASDDPVNEIGKIELSLKNKSISFPKYLYKDLFVINLSSLKLYYDKKGNLYIYMQNSDGAGAYEVVWKVNKDGIINRDINDYFQ